ncbi:MAG: Gfo/Idh/MocA family oxidoreductase [Verrucomicrobiae bacterium]|nr:Gfo/Idh/MocA family oxidoreductase [Verrucomicrobiae bacterium]
MNNSKSSGSTRREFLGQSALIAGALAAPAILTSKAFAADDTPLRVGLVGCGGRGTGAAGQALQADPHVHLVAMGDAFAEKIQPALQTLRTVADKQGFPERIKVTPETCFAGLDAYQKVIDSGVDVVLLCTPPGFRPQHFKAAVTAGKHVFCEKPMATDATGVRSVMETAKLARQKNLSVLAGFCWRYDYPRRELFQKLHDGAIGDIRSIYANYYTSPVKPMPAAETRPKDMGDVEWQVRNWYNFVWLSGDGLVEQACHSVDKIAWAMKDVPPLKAVAVGGRQIPNHQGNIYDHMFVVYEFENDVHAFLGQRQISNCFSENSDYIMGATGSAKITWAAGPVIHGKENWRFRGPKTDMYQNEHNEFFAGIRSGKHIFDADWMAQSTLMGIMGRMAAYTGQEVTWEEALNSKESIVPATLDWKMPLAIAPMAVPGMTPLI